MKKAAYLTVAIVIIGILIFALAYSVTHAVTRVAPAAETLVQTVPGVLFTVPDVQQSQPYSCGAASTQAVFSYWGIDEREGDLMAELHTSPDTGTTPEAIVETARNHGLISEMKTNLTLEDLRKSVADKVPVIIICQAWQDDPTDPTHWHRNREDGHYMVVIGLDEMNIYFEDPALLGTRGMIPQEQFLLRWHDYVGLPQYNAHGVALSHPGIFIQGKEPALYPAATAVQ